MPVEAPKPKRFIQASRRSRPTVSEICEMPMLLDSSRIWVAVSVCGPCSWASRRVNLPS